MVTLADQTFIDTQIRRALARFPGIRTPAEVEAQLAVFAARGFTLTFDPTPFVAANSAYNNTESFVEAKRLFPGWPRPGDPDIVIWPASAGVPLGPAFVGTPSSDCSTLHAALGWGGFSPGAICGNQALNIPVARAALTTTEERAAAVAGSGIGGVFGQIADVLRQGTEAIREVIPPEDVRQVIGIGAALVIGPAGATLISRQIAAEQAQQDQLDLDLQFTQPAPVAEEAPRRTGLGRILVPAAAILAAVLFLG